jgi:hypothetical protein
MADTDMQTPAFGEHGEPCQECAAPLAADQRYCLNCGRRRAEPRVDYRRLMGAPQDEQVVVAQEEDGAASAPAEPSKAGRDYAPLAAVGGIAVLGLMLLVGVLIGKGNNTTAAAPAPIVKVGGEVAGGTAGGESPAEPQTAVAKPKPKSSKSSKEGGTGAKTVAGGLTGSAARNSKETVQATTDDLEALNNQSGDSYQETIKKLPDKIATPGKPPPIDTTTAPGGGGAAETFK